MNTLSNRFEEECSLEQLSAREREILAHLIQHKTSKQIGLDLGLSENAVNKSIYSARMKWAARDRNEAAQIFEALSAGDRNYTPQFLSGDDDLHSSADVFPDLPRTTAFQFSDSLALEREDHWDAPAPMGLEALDRRFGKAWRIAAIPLIALVMGMVAMCSLVLAKELSDLL